MQGGKEPAVQAEGAQTDLTARVRALYEGTAVPVCEIARLAGVTERTIYKYAAKQQWKPRYAWTADGSRPRAWRAYAGFAPAKGAGGRFIRRADQDKAIAVGLKATDAAGAARADAACAHAKAIAAEAEHKARVDDLYDEWQEAAKELWKALDERQRYDKELAALPQGHRTPFHDSRLQTLHLCVKVAGEWWGESGRAYVAAMSERPNVEDASGTDEN